MKVSILLPLLEVFTKSVALTSIVEGINVHFKLGKSVFLIRLLLIDFHLVLSSGVE